MQRLPVLVALLVPLVVFGRTYYVSTTGNDNEPGTEAQPLATIQMAVSLARAGDTVLVRGGVYRGNVYLRFSGLSNAPITLKNFPGEQPVLVGEGKGRIELKAESGWQKPIGWIIVEGFEVRNGWDGIKFYNAHNIILRGNYLHDSLNQGILGNGHHVRIEANKIVHNGFKADNQRSNLEHGIYCTGSDFTIVGNVICSNKAYGIQVAGYPFKPDSHAGPEFADARRWLIAHNTIAFNQNRAGIVIWQRNAADCVIQNNIFYKNAVTLGGGATQGIDFVGAGPGHIIRNNLVFGPERTSIGQSALPYDISANLEKDPLFIAPERLNFHLHKDSPAIAAATSVLADTARTVKGAGHDIGALEHAK